MMCGNYTAATKMSIAELTEERLGPARQAKVSSTDFGSSISDTSRRLQLGKLLRGRRQGGRQWPSYQLRI